jgi:hypothetical protein
LDLPGNFFPSIVPDSDRVMGSNGTESSERFTLVWFPTPSHEVNFKPDPVNPGAFQPRLP